MTIDQKIILMPKIDLHRHLEGSIRPKTIYAMSKQSNKNYKLSQLKKNMHAEKDDNTLMKFLKKLGTPYMLECCTNKGVLTRFSYEAFEDAAKDNISYLELRFCPSNYYKTKTTAEEFIEGVYEGSKKAEHDFDIKTAIIISIKREESNKINSEIVKLALKYHKLGKINGVDLCGDEPNYPTRNYKDIFDIFYKNNIPITIHSGESRRVKDIDNVISAINHLHSRRIGHASIALKSQKTLDLIKQKSILIESCPTSSVQTGTVDPDSDIPTSKFKDYKLKLSINTDDPVTSDITLSQEYLTLINNYKFTIQDLIRTNFDSIEYAFLPQKVKVKLKKNYNRKIKHWAQKNLSQEEKDLLRKYLL